jgi:Rad3-related DNA helicase
VEVVTYQEGLSAREAAIAFKEGFGDVLLGTSMNYGEGVDLPKSIAPVIFFLRPSYPPPNDPAVQFESRRFGKGNSWRLWNWRVMIEALQVRGRNVRSAEDLGVTFLVSQQFRRFAHASLPEWLKPSYRGEMTFEECIKETRGLLK